MIRVALLLLVALPVAVAANPAHIAAERDHGQPRLSLAGVDRAQWTGEADDTRTRIEDLGDWDIGDARELAAEGGTMDHRERSRLISPLTWDYGGGVAYAALHVGSAAQLGIAPETDEVTIVTNTVDYQRIQAGVSERIRWTRSGTLYAGAAATLYRAATTLHRETASDVDDAPRQLRDGIGSGDDWALAPALDVGVLWRAHHYSAGLVVSDIGSPSWDIHCPYDCRLGLGNVDREARRDMQVTAEVAWHPLGRRWRIDVSHDLRQATDWLGPGRQWSRIGLAGRRWWASYAIDQAGNLDWVQAGRRGDWISLSAGTTTDRDGSQWRGTTFSFDFHYTW